LFQETQVAVKNDSTTTLVVDALLLLYVILAVVLMLNMLIALLNNTFEKIQGNCDIEWKYARSERLKVCNFVSASYPLLAFFCVGGAV
jgi:hypothetical protein